MVQGHDSTSYNKAASYNNYDCSSSKRTGFENMQKSERDRIQHKESNGKKTTDSSNKYGAWGSVFKNEQHFKTMHHC